MEPEEEVPSFEGQDNVNFQTPPYLCNFIAEVVKQSLGPDELIVEPTPGAGNMVAALRAGGFQRVEYPPGDFFKWLPSAGPAAIVGNPPWSPMTKAYEILFRCLDMNPRLVVMVMPWMTLLNSDSRIQKLAAKGLNSIIALPRSVFPGIRAGCCILVFTPELGTVQEVGVRFPTKEFLLGFAKQ
jgi:hypothetical protein